MLRKSQREWTGLLGTSPVVLSRWETGARKSRGKANDQLMRYLYLFLQTDARTRELSRDLQKALAGYFGRGQSKAVPIKLQLDPHRCSAAEQVRSAIDRIQE